MGLAVLPTFWEENPPSISSTLDLPAGLDEREASEHLVDLLPRADIEDCLRGHDNGLQEFEGCVDSVLFRIKNAASYRR